MHLFVTRYWRYEAIILILKLCVPILSIAFKIGALFIWTDPYLPHLVHVHVHILTGKESKYVPLFDFVLKCARATDFQTFYRPWEFYFKKHSTQWLFITNPELLISITEVLMSIESCWTICVFSCIVYITIITTPPGYVVVSNHDLSKNKFLYKVCFIYL